MRGHDERGAIRKRLGVALAACFAPAAPALVVWVALASFLRKIGWRYSLAIASGAGNVFLIVVIVLAIMDTDQAPMDSHREKPGTLTLPVGLVWRPQGSFVFAELAANEQGLSVLPSTVFLVLDGCVLASMEFDDGRQTIKETQLYDGKCRPRLTLDREKGGVTYTWYGDMTHPDYIVHDVDGDGVPDRRIDWDPEGSRSFARRADVEWDPEITCPAR